MNYKEIRHFEEAFAHFVGARDACAFWNARSASAAILRALGIGPGDEVIVPAYTCQATVSPVLKVGATPIYADIDPRTLGMDMAQLDSLLTPRVRVVIVQHTFGCRADVSATRDKMSRDDVVLIEDSTHCLGAFATDEMMHAPSAASYWSFGWGKAIPLGRGGMATTNHAWLGSRLYEEQKHARPPRMRDELSIALYKAVNDLFGFPALRPALARIYIGLSRLGAAPDDAR